VQPQYLNQRGGKVESIVKERVVKEILKIEGVSQEKDNLFSIDGTNYVIEVK